MNEYHLDTSLARDTAQTLDAFTLGYIEAAMWTLLDTFYACEDCEFTTRDSEENTRHCPECGGRMRERTESCDHLGLHDIAEETLAKAREDCAAFQAANRIELAEASGEQDRDDAHHGHDFWLTRCGHGVGFWDRGYSERVSTALTNAAHAEGNVDWYLGDDGKVYQG